MGQFREARCLVIIERASEHVVKVTEVEEPGQLSSDHSPDNVARGWWVGLTVVGAPLLSITLWQYVELFTITQKEDFVQAVSVLLAGVHLDRARLCGANLRGARLDGTHLWRALLPNGIFVGAHIEKVQVQRADCEETIPCHTNLNRVNLQRADLPNVMLCQAIGLTQQQIDWTVGDEATAPPDGVVRHRRRANESKSK
jgi:hypothetical protein